MRDKAAAAAKVLSIRIPNKNPYSLRYFPGNIFPVEMDVDGGLDNTFSIWNIF